MKIYCTLFDKNYVIFGVTLLESLLRFGGKAYVLCLDEETYTTLSALKNPSIILIKYEVFYPEVFKVIEQKCTYPQRCWVAQPYLCEYVLNNYNEPSVTYIDSDCYFFSDPAPLFKEVEGFSVGAVPHNFHKEYENLAKEAGEYCAHFNYFQNDEKARIVIEDWKNDCLLYTKERPHECIGQLGMDKWKKYPFFKTITNLAAGVAPWNSRKFKITKKDNIFHADDYPVIFYHFHGLYKLTNQTFYKGNYEFDTKISNEIYYDYLKETEKTSIKLKNLTDIYYEVRKYKISRTFFKNTVLRLLQNKSVNIIRVKNYFLPVTLK